MNQFLKQVLAIKMSTFTLATVGCVTYAYHAEIERGIDTLLYKKVEIQEGFFKDPIGVGIERIINEHGKREVYVKHEPSGLRYQLGEDGYPSYSNIFEQITREIKSGNIPIDHAKKYRSDVQKLEYLLNEQIEKKQVVLAGQK